MDNQVIEGGSVRVLSVGKPRPLPGKPTRLPPARDLDREKDGFSKPVLILLCVFLGALGTFWCWLQSGPSAALHLMTAWDAVQWLLLTVLTAVLVYFWLRFWLRRI